MKARLKNLQIQGAKLREHEAYVYYDECLSGAGNAVAGDFCGGLLAGFTDSLLSNMQLNIRFLLHFHLLFLFSNFLRKR